MANNNIRFDAEIQGNLAVRNPILVNGHSASVDYCYGPWESIAQACSIITKEFRMIGKTIAVYDTQKDNDGNIIYENGEPIITGVTEYQWKTGIEDGDLIEKSRVLSTVSIEAPTELSYSEILEDTVVPFYITFNSNNIGNAIITRRVGEGSPITLGTYTLASGPKTPILITIPKTNPDTPTSYTYEINVTDFLGKSVSYQNNINSFTISVGSIVMSSNFTIKYTNNWVKDENIQIRLTLRSKPQTKVKILVKETTDNISNPKDFSILESGTYVQYGTDGFEVNNNTESVQSFTYDMQLKSTPGLNNRLTITATSDQESTALEYTYIYLDEENPYYFNIRNITDTTTVGRASLTFLYLTSKIDASRISYKYYKEGEEANAQIYTTSLSYEVNKENTLNLIQIDTAGTYKLKIGIDNYWVEEEKEFKVTQYSLPNGVAKDPMLSMDYDLDTGKVKDCELVYNVTDIVKEIEQDTNGNTVNSYVIFNGKKYAYLINNNQVADTNKYNPFGNYYNYSQGMTLEIKYNAKNIGDQNVPVITTFSDTTKTQVGVEITSEKILVGTGSANFEVDTGDDEWIHATIVWDKSGFTNEGEYKVDVPYIYVYLNGCLVALNSWQPLSVPASQIPNTNTTWYLNTDSSQSSFGYVKQELLRFYEKPLSMPEVYENYVSSIYNEAQKSIVRGRNEEVLPTITFIERKKSGIQKWENDDYTISGLLDQTDKERQKKEIVYCTMKYDDGKKQSNSVTYYHFVELITQGTSTLRYPIKNWKITLYQNPKEGTTYYETDEEGNQFVNTQLTSDNWDSDNWDSSKPKKRKVQFKKEEGWSPESKFTLKCDYMESSHLNNTPSCTYYNDIIDTLVDKGKWNIEDTSPARQGYDIDGNVRTYTDTKNVDRTGYLDAIKGFPCIVNYIDAQGTSHYLGTYMFNLDKSAASLGFDVAYKDTEGYHKSNIVSIEGKANTTKGAGSFYSIDYWKNNISGYKETVPDGESNDDYTHITDSSVTQDVIDLAKKIANQNKKEDESKVEYTKADFDSSNVYGYYLTSSGYYFEAYTKFKSDSNVNQTYKNAINDFATFILCYSITGQNYYWAEGNIDKTSLISIGNDDSYYIQDFETREIYNEDYEKNPSKWHNWKNIISTISEWYEKIVENPSETELQKDINSAKEIFEQYFNLNYTLLYYVQMITFAMVDNAGKNCMWDCWDGTKWFPRPYDLDTMAGLNNSGYDNVPAYAEYSSYNTGNDFKKGENYALDAGKKGITDDYRDSRQVDRGNGYEDAEDLKKLRFSSYNTSDSRMWKLFYRLYYDEVQQLYKTLREIGVYDVTNICNYYFNLTSDIIGETYYNKDSLHKFIKPEKGDSQLAVLHGNRRNRFKKWLTDRIEFCDTLFMYNRTLDNAITFRLGESSYNRTLVFKTYFPVYIEILAGTKDGTIDAYYKFLCAPDSVYNANEDEGVQITLPSDLPGNKETIIYGASAIKEINGLKQLQSEDLYLQNASRISFLDISYMSKLTVLQLGDNKYLQKFDGANIGSLGSNATTLDFSKATNLKELNLYNSPFTTVKFHKNENEDGYEETVDIALENINVANTKITDLSIKNALFLETVNIEGCNNLTSLKLENCALSTLNFSGLSLLQEVSVKGCNFLEEVVLSNLRSLVLESTAFINCERLKKLSITDCINTKKDDKDLVLTLTNVPLLETLDIHSTYGIDQVKFDDKDAALKEVDISYTDIKVLEFPANKNQADVTLLNCQSCVNLEYITNINADLGKQEGVFKHCKSLKLINGTKLHSLTGQNFFLGCTSLYKLDIKNNNITFDFKEKNEKDTYSFSKVFSRCYNLPWSEAKKVLNVTNASNVDANSVFRYRYIKKNIEKPEDIELPTGYDTYEDYMSTIPTDIFKNVASKVTSLAQAFSYSPSNEADEDYSSYKDSALNTNSYTRVTKFAGNLESNGENKQTNLSLQSMFYGSYISFPDTSESFTPLIVFKNAVNASDIFGNCSKITNIPVNIFQHFGNVTTLAGAFQICDNLTDIPEGLLNDCTSLISATGMFYGGNETNRKRSAIKDYPANLFKNCKKIQYISALFANTPLETAKPLFISDGTSNENMLDNTDSEQNFTNNLIARAMFARCTNLKGILKGNKYVIDGSLFAVKRTGQGTPDSPYIYVSKVSNVGDYLSAELTNDAIPHRGRSDYPERGLFYSCNITEVQCSFFNSICNTSSCAGMFYNCSSLSLSFERMKIDTAGNDVFDPFNLSLENPYNSVYKFTKVTNIARMFCGCKGDGESTGFKNIYDIPRDTVTNMQGFAAYSNIDSIAPLSGLQDMTKLTNAQGAYTGTKINVLPDNMFKGCTNLQRIGHIFRDCYNLRTIQNLSLADCQKLEDIKYAFSGCTLLGAKDTEDTTIPKDLFQNNLNLTTVEGLFQFCTALKGSIPDIFTNESNNYTKLINVSKMFYRANIEPDENGYIFNNSLFIKCTSITNVNTAFANINVTGLSVIDGTALDRNYGEFKLNAGHTMFNSPVQDASFLFAGSKLTGTIPVELLSQAKSSLTNIEGMFEYCDMTGFSRVSSGRWLINEGLKTGGANDTLINAINVLLNNNNLSKTHGTENAIDNYMYHFSNNERFSNSLVYQGCYAETGIGTTSAEQVTMSGRTNYNKTLKNPILTSDESVSETIYKLPVTTSYVQ